MNVKQNHFVISVLKNINAVSIEKEFLNKGNELTKNLKNPLFGGTMRMQNCESSKSGSLLKPRVWSGFKIFLLIQILF